LDGRIIAGIAITAELWRKRQNDRAFSSEVDTGSRQENASK
jgi:hypothetical protein